MYLADYCRQPDVRPVPKPKVSFAISRIASLAFRTDFDCARLTGNIPVNVTFIPEKKFPQAAAVMSDVFARGLCSSPLVAIAGSQEMIGGIQVPLDCVAFVTVCSIVVNGCLLKAGVPIDSKFGGILQMNRHAPLRFTEVIHYNASSLDPSEIFIRAGMTSLNEVVKTGDGEILANFREIPSLCQPVASQVVHQLKTLDLSSVFLIGETSQPVCEVNVVLNRIAIVLLGGLNPIAAVVEKGIPVENHSMSTLIGYHQLKNYREILS